MIVMYIIVKGRKEGGGGVQNCPTTKPCAKDTALIAVINMQSEDLLSRAHQNEFQIVTQSFIFLDGRLNNSHADTQYARNPRVTAPGFRTHNPHYVAPAQLQPNPTHCPRPVHSTVICFCHLSKYKVQTEINALQCVCVEGGGGGGEEEKQVQKPPINCPARKPAFERISLSFCLCRC